MTTTGAAEGDAPTRTHRKPLRTSDVMVRLKADTTSGQRVPQFGIECGFYAEVQNHAVSEASRYWADPSPHEHIRPGPGDGRTQRTRHRSERGRAAGSD